MNKRIILAHRLRQRMLDHALEQPDLEVCGLIGGINNLPQTYYPVKNIADDPSCSFLMDPLEQIHAMRKMRELGESMTGIFHSHPGSTASPSAKDLTDAYYPDVYYFIASLLNPAPKLKAYFFDGGQFNEVLITDNT